MGRVSNSEAEKVIVEPSWPKKQKCWAIPAKLLTFVKTISHPGSESLGLQSCQLSYVFLNGNCGAHSYMLYKCELREGTERPGRLRSVCSSRI